MHKRALFEGWENLIFPTQAFHWTSRNGANSLLIKKKELAEREGFEPPVRFPVHLISSQAPSTGLGHLSVFLAIALLRSQAGKKRRKHRGRLIGKHTFGNWQLVIESLIFTQTV